MERTKFLEAAKKLEELVRLTGVQGVADHDVACCRECDLVVRIDPLRFLAGCRTRRLNQAISVLYLSMFYCVVVY